MNFKQKSIAAAVVIATIFISSTAMCGELKITKKGYFASLSERDFDNAVMYVMDGDKQAVGKMISKGRVFVLKAGVGVYIVDFVFPGKVKIRPRGEQLEVWTFYEAVK